MADAPKSQRSLGCCLLKILVLLFFMGLLGAGLVGYSIYHAATWFTHVAEAQPAKFKPLAISPGEQQDIDRLATELSAGKTSRELIDESITPNVFNGLMQAIIQSEKNKGKETEIEGIRGDIKDGHLSLAFSAHNKKSANEFDSYFNGRTVFDLEIEEGVVKNIELHSLAVGGQEAPWAVKRLLNNFILPKLRNPNDADSKRNAQAFKPIRLLKLEGERLHIILDPALFKKELNDVPAPPPGEQSKSKTEF